VRKKLLAYSLDIAHQHGGPKARGFERILGITVEHVDHLEGEIRAGILTEPVSAIRAAIPTGFSCVVEVKVRGLRPEKRASGHGKNSRLLTGPGAPPRMTTAFPKP